MYLEVYLKLVTFFKGKRIGLVGSILAALATILTTSAWISDGANKFYEFFGSELNNEQMFSTGDKWVGSYQCLKAKRTDLELHIDSVKVEGDVTRLKATAVYSEIDKDDHKTLRVGEIPLYGEYVTKTKILDLQPTDLFGLRKPKESYTAVGFIGIVNNDSASGSVKDGFSVPYDSTNIPSEMNLLTSKTLCQDFYIKRAT